MPAKIEGGIRHAKICNVSHRENPLYWDKDNYVKCSIKPSRCLSIVSLFLVIGMEKQKLHYVAQHSFCAMPTRRKPNSPRSITLPT